MAKIKAKTHSGCKKRFKMTKKGKILSLSCGRRHLNSKWSRKKQLNKKGTVALCKADSAGIITKLIPNGL